MAATLITAQLAALVLNCAVLIGCDLDQVHDPI